MREVFASESKVPIASVSAQFATLLSNFRVLPLIYDYDVG